MIRTSLGLVSIFALALIACSCSYKPVVEELRRVRSPDGRVELVVTRSSAGAMSSFAYRVCVVPAAGKCIEDNEVLMAEKADTLNVSWTASRHATITYDVARIYRFKNFWLSKNIDNFQYEVGISLSATPCSS